VAVLRFSKTIFNIYHSIYIINKVKFSNNSHCFYRIYIYINTAGQNAPAILCKSKRED